MKMRYLTLVAALGFLAACTTTPQTSTSNGSNGMGASNNGGASTSSITPGSQADFVANVGDRVFFDLDKYSLNGEARANLGKWVTFLKTYPNDRLTIEGHCDERGTREYNLALGERRANSVKEFLVAQGVDAGRLKTISYGKERPAVLGHNEAAWAQNRRGVGVVQ